MTFSQAALGGEITVPTLEGEEQIKIPSGTQSGAIFRLKGRGVPSLNGRGKGDELVRVKLITPSKLTSQQKELFQKLADISEEPEASGNLFEKMKEMWN